MEKVEALPTQLLCVCLYHDGGRRLLLWVSDKALGDSCLLRLWEDLKLIVPLTLPLLGCQVLCEPRALVVCLNCPCLQGTFVLAEKVVLRQVIRLD